MKLKGLSTRRTAELLETSLLVEVPEEEAVLEEDADKENLNETVAILAKQTTAMMTELTIITTTKELKMETAMNQRTLPEVILEAEGVAVQEEEEAGDVAVEATEATAVDEAAGATEEIDQKEMETVGKADGKTTDRSTVTDPHDAVEAVVAADVADVVEAADVVDKMADSSPSKLDQKNLLSTSPYYHTYKISSTCY